MTFRHTTKAEEEAILHRYADIMKRREKRDAQLSPRRRRIAWEVDDMIDRVNATRAAESRIGVPAPAKEELESFTAEAKRDMRRWKMLHRKAYGVGGE